MVSVRRVQPSPLPGVELARMKDQLAPYGCELWDREGTRVLVIRVPRDEPDLVNDLETAVEYVSASDLQDVPRLLLLGNQKVHQLPAQILQDLLAARIAYDRRQCQVLRGSLPKGQHRVYRAPDDPHRLPRLAYRLPCESLKDIQDADLAPLLAEVGPRARESPYAEVRIVYLIADKDEVRIEGDLFFQDMHGRWVDAQERQRLAAEIEAQQEEDGRRREEARRALLSSLEARRAAAHTALPSPAPAAEEAGDRVAMYAEIEALFAARKAEVRARAAPGLARHAPAESAGDPAAPRREAPLLGAGPSTATASVPARTSSAAKAVVHADAPPAPPAMPPALAVLQARLGELRYDVVVGAPAPHGVELAAERAEGYPQRVIAYAPDRLDLGVAEKVLAACRALDADMALVVCPDWDAEAKRRFIATPARHLEPAEIGNLEL